MIGTGGLAQRARGTSEEVSALKKARARRAVVVRLDPLEVGPAVTDRTPGGRFYRAVSNTKPPPRRSTGSASRRWSDSGLKPSEAMRVRNKASPENR